MVNNSPLFLAIRNAIEESKKAPGIIYYVFSDSIDSFGIVPEQNTFLYQSRYPGCSLIAKYCNGEKVG